MDKEWVEAGHDRSGDDGNDTEDGKVIEWEAISDRLAVLEGLLFAAGTEGLTDKQLARVFRMGEAEAAALCETLYERQRREGRLFRVSRVADAWQLLTLSELAPYLWELALTPASEQGLSQAALETLAIIAYNQPVTRIGIEEIRGVKSEKALGTLVARGLVRETGRAEGPGRPFLYGTTKEFLEYFGLPSLKELPPIGDLD